MPRSFFWSAVVVSALMGATALAEEETKGQESDSSFEGSLRQPDGLYDAAAHSRRQQVSVHGIFVFGWGIGAGGRYSLPLLKDGFLPEVNESIEIDLGVDFIFPMIATAVGAILMIAAEPRWTFHVTPQFDAYVKLGVVGQIYFAGPPGMSPLWVVAGLGGTYRLSNTLSVRAEVGNLPKLGIAYDF